MTLRHDVPYWLDRPARSRVPRYPRHRGHLDVDVAIMGGGLTGCAAAYAFAAAGVRVGVFEAGRLASASTGRSLGLLLQEPHGGFQDLVQAHGLRVARAVWQATRRAALDCAATLRRREIRCDLTPESAIQLARTPEHAKVLRREYAARRAAGLEVSWLSATALDREVATPGEGGLRTRGNWHLDPYRASLGLAAAAVRCGAAVFERSPVARIRGARKLVELRTERGTVTARSVIVATGLATRAFQPLRRHFKAMTTYLVMTERLPPSVRRELGPRQAMLHDLAVPPHRLRWMPGDRVMFAGADQPETPRRGREQVLVQRTGQLMYELSLLYPAISGYRAAYGWDAGFGSTSDGLPYIGPHRNYPRHLFALGYGRNGLAPAFLASRLLLRRYLDAPAKGDDLFGFGR